MLPLVTPAEGPDEMLFHLLNLAGSNPILDAFMIAVTTLGAAYLLAIVAVPLWWRGRREAAFDLLILLGITVVVTEAIKFAVGRPRPCDVLTSVRNLAGYGCDVEFDPSFPSGHASRAFAFATFLAFRYRGRVGAAAFAFAFLVGLSRIYLGVHWPSDVLAGALLGVALALAVERMSLRSDGYRRLRSWVLSKIPHRRPAIR
ncbi:MAG TPA: phosphatase PAP2 family protein [Thermoplasmata archaeon]|nr:phosphatase PAP2 family protein [Thermoplasmata archaeon]